jgi:hypothetical protein
MNNEPLFVSAGILKAMVANSTLASELFARQNYDEISAAIGMMRATCAHFRLLQH